MAGASRRHLAVAAVGVFVLALILMLWLSRRDGVDETVSADYGDPISAAQAAGLAAAASPGASQSALLIKAFQGRPIPEVSTDDVPVCGLSSSLPASPPGEGASSPEWPDEWTSKSERLRREILTRWRASKHVQERVLAGLLSDDDLDAAAELVRHSQDARLYGLVLKACGLRPSAQCAQLSAARWAQLDAGNLAAWLTQIEAAKAQGDEGAVLEAMHRATQATRLDHGHGWVLSQLLAALPAESDAVDLGPRLDLIVAVRQRAQRGERNGVRAVNRTCSNQALLDSNLKQLCHAFSRNLLRHAESGMDVMMGLQLGERSGLPKTDTEALRAQLKTATHWLRADLEGGPEKSLSCSTLRRAETWFRTLSTQGEWAALRQGLAAANAASAASGVRP